MPWVTDRLSYCRGLRWEGRWRRRSGLRAAAAAGTRGCAADVPRLSIFSARRAVVIFVIGLLSLLWILVCMESCGRCGACACGSRALPGGPRLAPFSRPPPFAGARARPCGHCVAPLLQQLVVAVQLMYDSLSFICTTIIVDGCLCVHCWHRVGCLVGDSGRSLRGLAIRLRARLCLALWPRPRRGLARGPQRCLSSLSIRPGLSDFTCRSCLAQLI